MRFSADYHNEMFTITGGCGVPMAQKQISASETPQEITQFYAEAFPAEPDSSINIFLSFHSEDF